MNRLILYGYNRSQCIFESLHDSTLLSAVYTMKVVATCSMLDGDVVLFMAHEGIPKDQIYSALKTTGLF